MPLVNKHQDYVPLLEMIEKYLKSGTSTDRDYYKITSYFIVSSIIGNNVVIKRPFGNVHTNIWAILIGPSTISHKSTLLSMAYEILSDVMIDNITSQDYSPEGLFAELSEMSGNGEYPTHAVSIMDEFAGFVQAMGKKDYMANTKELMMQLYDSRKKIKRRLKKEHYTIRDPYFVWITATSMEGFLDAFKIQDIQTGFLPRFIPVFFNRNRMINETIKDITTIESMKNNVVAACNALYNALKHKKISVYIPTLETNETYKSFINKVNYSPSEISRSIAGRMSINIFKFATIKYISDYYMDIVYNVDKTIDVMLPDNYITEATNIISDFLTKELDVIFEYVGWDKNIRTVYQFIKEYTIISHSKLLWRSHLKANEFRQVIETLTAAGVIASTILNRTTYYYMPDAFSNIQDINSLISEQQKDNPQNIQENIEIDDKRGGVA